MRLISVNAGLPKDHGGWTSGVFKFPVAGPVAVRRTNLDGDGQADLRVHGGPDRALLAFAADAYPAWCRDLGLASLPYGSFGENLSVSGLDEGRVRLGERWRIGDVELEVSQPRQPCGKLNKRLGISRLPDSEITARTGWYLRVLREGTIAAGAAVERLDHPAARWSIDDLVRLRRKGGPREELAALAADARLSESWRGHFSGLLA